MDYEWSRSDKVIGDYLFQTLTIACSKRVRGTERGLALLIPLR